MDQLHPKYSSVPRVLLSILLICLTVIWGIRKWKRRHLERIASKFPGASALPFVGNALIFFNKPREEYVSILLEYAKSFKSPSKFWLGEKLLVFISKPEDLQIVLNSSKTLGKDDTYRFFMTTFGTGLVIAPVGKWKKTRKTVATSFTPNLVTRFVPVMSARANITIQNIQKHCGSGAEIDIYPHIFNATFDALCEASFGVQINTQLGQNPDFAPLLIGLADLVATRIYSPWLHMDFIYKKTGSSKTMHKDSRVFREFIHKIIQERNKSFSRNNYNRAAGAGNVDHITEEGDKNSEYLLDGIHSSHEDGLYHYTDTDKIDEGVVFMVAGSETTALTNSFCLLMLAMHPEYQDKVFEEQYSIFGGTDRPVTLEDLEKMEYTGQVLKETLRMFPVLPLYLRYVEEDTKLTQGYVLPAGSTAVIAPLMTHYDPTLWQEPEKFNPDNFSPENRKLKHKYALMTFSGGARGCIGKKYAMLAMKTTISTFIRHFSLSTTKSLKDVDIYLNLVLRCKGGWNIKLEPRIKQKS